MIQSINRYGSNLPACAVFAAGNRSRAPVDVRMQSLAAHMQGRPRRHRSAGEMPHGYVSGPRETKHGSLARCTHALRVMSLSRKSCRPPGVFTRSTRCIARHRTSEGAFSRESCSACWVPRLKLVRNHPWMLFTQRAGTLTPYAECSNASTTTIFNPADASSMAGCATFTGSIAVATSYAEGTLEIHNMTTVAGNLIIEDNSHIGIIQMGELFWVGNILSLSCLSAVALVNFSAVSAA